MVSHPDRNEALYTGATIGTPRPTMGGRTSIVGVAVLLVVLAQPRLPFVATASSQGDALEHQYGFTAGYWILLSALLAWAFMKYFMSTISRSRARTVVGLLLPLLMIWVCLSVLGASDIWLSLRNAIPFLIVTVIGVSVGAAEGHRRVFYIASVAAGIVLLLSAYYIIFHPSIGRAYPFFPNVWRGAFANQNDLGRWASVALALAIGHMLSWRRLRRAAAVLALVFAGVAVVRSGSGQAILISLGTIALGLAIVSLGFLSSLRRVMWPLLGLGAGFAGVIVWASWGEILTALGESSDLNSRVPIWVFSFGTFLDRPLLGYGFGGYWQTTLPDLHGVVAATGLRAHQAHNTILDALLQVGLVGALLLVVVLIRTGLRLWRKVRLELDGAWLSLLLVFVVLAIYGMTASMIMGPRLEWWFLVSAMLGVVSRKSSAITRAGPPSGSA